MTQDKKTKKDVRARMAKTGESYSTARKNLLAATAPPRPQLPQIDLSYAEDQLRNYSLISGRVQQVEISLCEVCDSDLAVAGLADLPSAGSRYGAGIAMPVCASCAMSMIQDGFKSVAAAVASEDRDVLISRLIEGRRIELQREELIKRGQKPWEVAPDLFRSPFAADNL